MNGCHQSYPWRKDSKNPLIYPVAANNWLVEWSGKAGYMGRDRLCPHHSEQLEQYNPWQTALRKVPVFEDEGATMGAVSVEYTRSTVQSKSPQTFLRFNVSSLAGLRVQGGLMGVYGHHKLGAKSLSQFTVSPRNRHLSSQPLWLPSLFSLQQGKLLPKETLVFWVLPR